MRGFLSRLWIHKQMNAKRTCSRREGQKWTRSEVCHRLSVSSVHQCFCPCIYMYFFERHPNAIFMDAPARVAIQTFHQPTNQPTNQSPTALHRVSICCTLLCFPWKQQDSRVPPLQPASPGLYLQYLSPRAGEPASHAQRSPPDV